VAAARAEAWHALLHRTDAALAEYGVSGREASTRWPPMFERLARFLA
jgi:hypothetical protein